MIKRKNAQRPSGHTNKDITKRQDKQEIEEYQEEEQSMDYSYADQDDDDSSSSEDDDDNSSTETSSHSRRSGQPRHPRHRLLLIPSRGITFRHRHLLLDLAALLPHSKKDVKLDAKNDLSLLNELAELSNASHVAFLESRKHEDLYLWLSDIASNGPSVKFLLSNLHTSAEVSLRGNCLRNTRAILSFDSAFQDESHPELMVMRAVLAGVFGAPEGHRKTAPYYDHVFSFAWLDGRVWFRNYQIVQGKQASSSSSSGNQSVTPAVASAVGMDEMTLVEVGPRFCLQPIKIMEKSFAGRVLYQNEQYVSPNAIRAAEKKQFGSKYLKRQEQKTHAMDRMIEMAEDQLEEIFKD